VCVRFQGYRVAEKKYLEVRAVFLNLFCHGGTLEIILKCQGTLHKKLL
jgi:hypothetical protein